MAEDIRHYSNLTDNEWAVLEPVLPKAEDDGRPRFYPLREIVNGILYAKCTGCSWRTLPKSYPPWPTVYHYYRHWKATSIWESLDAILQTKVEGQDVLDRAVPEEHWDSEYAREKNVSTRDTNELQSEIESELQVVFRGIARDRNINSLFRILVEYSIRHHSLMITPDFDACIAVSSLHGQNYAILDELQEHLQQRGYDIKISHNWLRRFVGERLFENQFGSLNKWSPETRQLFYIFRHCCAELGRVGLRPDFNLDRANNDLQKLQPTARFVALSKLADHIKRSKGPLTNATFCEYIQGFIDYSNPCELGDAMSL